MDLNERIRVHLTEQLGAPVDSVEARPLPGGACQDNLRVSAKMGEQSLRLVLRSDARMGLPGSLGRATERLVIDAAVTAGVPTPAARWPIANLLREGADAYFLDFAPGVAIGAKVTRDPALAAARQRLPEQLAAALAAVHRVKPAGGPPLHAPADPVAQSLQVLRDTLDELPDPRPALELAFRWLERNRPKVDEVVLTHGDFRTGNFLVTPEGLSAVLDWEFAHYGAPVEDIGWLCVRDWRFGAPELPAGGLCSRKRFCDAYSQASGRSVDMAELRWWEVYGNVRWAGGALMQGQRVMRGQARDLELLAIPWRSAEMEYEALRLIGGA